VATAYVGLGSNVGDRDGFLRGALAALEAHPEIRVGPVSTVRETAPVGGPPQGPFRNAAAALETTLEAPALLAVLKDVEVSLGRRPGPRWGPREIDLDLLLYDDLVAREPGFEVPHPRLAERAFVLEPLAEIAPEVLHPTLSRSVRDLWRDLRRSRPEDVE
jgi:2-amino-4-hydroxy-6-hydroxymethyldihydropteridine diphosphokinase